MSRRKILIRALTGALTVATIAAPAVQAYPADMHASVAQAAAAKTQDLRSPDARDAAVQPRLAIKGGTAALQSAPTWPANPKPVAPQPVVTDSGGGSDIDWATIGIGVLLSAVAVGTLAALAARRQRRLPRMRVGA